MSMTWLPTDDRPFSGSFVSAIFGCDHRLTIPVGLGLVRHRIVLLHAGSCGAASIPVAFWPASGLRLSARCDSSLHPPHSADLSGAVYRADKRRRRRARFSVFARGVQAIASLGLTLGAVQYMTGFCPLGSLAPLAEAMETVCAIGIVMLGSMPLAELVQRLLKVPFRWIGEHTGLNEVSTTGLLIGLVSVTPALAMIPRMDNAARCSAVRPLVCGASAFFRAPGLRPQRRA